MGNYRCMSDDTLAQLGLLKQVSQYFRAVSDRMLFKSIIELEKLMIFLAWLINYKNH